MPNCQTWNTRTNLSFSTVFNDVNNRPEREVKQNTCVYSATNCPIMSKVCTLLANVRLLSLLESGRI